MQLPRNLARAWGMVLVGVAALAGAALAGDEDPRLGGKQGRLRYRIARSRYEQVETPDVVTWKDGTRREAYFLEVYGDWLVYYVKETETSWLKEEVPRSQVAGVDFLQYLDQDPLQPKVIEPARKQPLPKEELLMGTFVAEQGKHSRWRFEFTSEIDKIRDFSEDAMDHGTFKVSSETLRKDTAARPVHEVRGEGNYWLYAPGSVNNKEWVLVLSEVIQREVDRGRETILWTNPVPSETFILYFTPRRDEFQLQWSNLGSWTWGSLVNLKFQKLETENRGQDRGAETPKPRVLPARSAPGWVQNRVTPGFGTTPSLLAGEADPPPHRPRNAASPSSAPSRGLSSMPKCHSTPVTLEPCPAPTNRKSPAAGGGQEDWALASNGARWGVDGWKRPKSLWSSSR